jgi:ComF family protein
MQNLLHLLLPNQCALCQQTSERGICTECEVDYFSKNIRRCEQCGIPLNSKIDSRCGNCIKTPPFFDATFVSCNYNAPIDSLVLGLKFGHHLHMATLIAGFLEQTIHSSLKHMPANPAIFCPVPLSRQRLITRGFNQSLEIARQIKLPAGGILIPDLIWRLKNTLQQSSLHPDDRYRNVRGAFFPNPALAYQIQGRHLAVIDDVITTGTTLNAIAQVLKQAGAVRVTNFIFARTTWH